MIQIKIVGHEEMKRRLDKFGAEVHKESSVILKEIAKNAAVNAASTAFPRGTSTKTRDSLHKAIYKDIIRAYQPAEGVTITDDGSYLESNRNARGRVSRTTKRKVISQASYDTIRQEKIRTSGLVKAAWLQCADSVGVKKVRIPVWLRKDFRFGTSTIKGSGWETTVELNNDVRYSSRLISDAQLTRTVSYAYVNYLKMAEKRMQILASKV